jgi:hypothetical protein
MRIRERENGWMLEQSILKAIFFVARELKDGNTSPLLFYKLIRSSVSRNFKI